MSRLRMQITTSLDGYVAGPNQSLENPLGEGGERLHEWAIELAAWRTAHGMEGGEVNASTPVMENMLAGKGATIMGRKMFGGGPGGWEAGPDGATWNGWWGDDPPFHMPVFVLTHHAREPLQLQGGTTFHFVTDGIESALERARAAADGKDIHLAGGASVAQQYLRAGLLDELTISVVPILLGGGERLLDDVGAAGLALRCTRVVEAPGVTHLTYSVNG